MTTDKIDIVLPWVDGQEEVWLNNFNKFASQCQVGDCRPIRYRDWNLLRYWFRGVERFMPWIDTIHFITSGHIPNWLNVNHPQLNWVKHDEFIPSQYLPTFNINTIELNLHRIENLSEQFIYFNDDIFVLKPLSEDRFFRKGLPCDSAIMSAKPAGGGIIHIAINDLEIINSNFDKHKQIKKHLSKWFNLKYGKGIINNLLLLPWKEYSGFIDPHLPNSFLKSTYYKIWEQTPDILDDTCVSKFRNNNNVNQWLVRYWQLTEGRFSPFDTRKHTSTMDITDDSILHICRLIFDQSYQMICLNDSDVIDDFEKTKALLIESFEKILPDRSKFEI